MDLSEYHQSVRGLFADNTRTYCYPSSIRLLSCCCLYESDESIDCQKILLLHSVQTPSATPISRYPNDKIHLLLVRLDRDDLGYLCRQISSSWRVGANSNPFPFTCRNDSLFERRITEKIAEMVRTNFLVAFRSMNLLSAIGFSFFHTRFFPFWFLKGGEKFVTGSELLFVVLDFMHKTLCFSGDQNVRCLSWIESWWNWKISNPFSSTMFTIRTSITGQTIVPQELLHRLVIQDELEKMCIPGQRRRMLHHPSFSSGRV